jgi:arginyl-tRNA synthetase
VARVVGLGAVKYNDLSKDRQTLVTFTWDKALSLQGNTAPYLQYAYARIRSIIRKGGEAPRRAEVVLGTPVERALAKRILGYPEVVEQAGRTARPHFLCDYLYELATAFSGFYADHPVLKAEPAVRASRLVLTELVARILQHGLGLLGIEVLERM